jgi:hypothetical protein
MVLGPSVPALGWNVLEEISISCVRRLIYNSLPLWGSSASRKGLSVEFRDSVVADELSGLVTRLGEGLISGSRGVETIRVGVGGSVNVTGSHFD